MRLVLAISGFIALLAVGLLLFGERLDLWFGGEQGLVWLRERGHWAGVVGAGLIVSDLFLPMPAGGIMAGLGQIYGGVIGGIYAAVGSVCAGLVAYGLTRMIGQRAAVFIAGEENLIKLKRFYEQQGAWAIAITRVLPVVPEVLCCLAGLSRMPFTRFLIALVCGSLPLSFIFAAYGSTAGDEPISNMLIAIVVPAILFLPVWLIISRMSRRKHSLEDN